MENTLTTVLKTINNVAIIIILGGALSGCFFGHPSNRSLQKFPQQQEISQMHQQVHEQNVQMHQQVHQQNVQQAVHHMTPHTHMGM